jgi:hypothetical protein
MKTGLSTKVWEKAYEIENFIKNFVPSGWVEPVGKVMFTPRILPSDIPALLEGYYPDTPSWNQPMVRLAMDEYRKKCRGNNHVHTISKFT